MDEIKRQSDARFLATEITQAIENMTHEIVCALNDIEKSIDVLTVAIREYDLKTIIKRVDDDTLENRRGVGTGDQ